MVSPTIEKGMKAYQMASFSVNKGGGKNSPMSQEKKAWEAAQEMEKMCAGKFIQHLFAGNKEGLFGGGYTETMFRSYFTQSIAEKAPLNLRIAESIYPVLLKNQGEKR